MVKIFENYPLKALNTFHIEAKARYFAEAFSPLDIIEILNDKFLKKMPVLILGRGSNMLFTKDFKGLVLKISIPGIKVTGEDQDFAFVKAGAGEQFHNLVIYCIDRNLGGIENLSLIPGSVGASPVQNIGAYGVELKDVFFELEGLMVESGRIKRFSKTDCQFGYRESIFKAELRGKCIIVSVTLKLAKKPSLNTSYGSIDQELVARNIKNPTIKDISDAIIHIRKSKLPDPALLGNAGSFFKNPTVTKVKFERLKAEFPDLVAFASVPTRDQPGGEYWKLAAGWLIEKAGWKGKRMNDHGVHKQQSLVLVNYGNAKGSEVLELSRQIMEDVKIKFDVVLEREVNII